MSDSDLQREMARLAERLERIERRLGIEPEPDIIQDAAASAEAPQAVDTPEASGLSTAVSDRGASACR